MTHAKHTTWPVIWSRTLRSHNAVARHNALAAARVLRERRMEREMVEDYYNEQVGGPSNGPISTEFSHPSESVSITPR